MAAHSIFTAAARIANVSPQQCVPPAERPGDDTALLVVGPPMTNKFGFLSRTLDSGEPVVFLSTTKNAERVRDGFDETDADDVAVVDCVTKAPRTDVESDANTRYVVSPDNLTDLGMKFVDLAESREDEDVVVGVHSLSDLLVYSSPEQVYQFVRVLLGHVREFDWALAATLDGASADEQTRHMLRELFDVVVDTRTTDGGREARVRYADGTRTEWAGF